MPDANAGLLGALGLCRKAGALLWGADRVQEAVINGKARLVLLACDASPRTQARFTGACTGGPQLCTLPLATGQLAPLTPRPAAVYAVTDTSLARLCAAKLAHTQKTQPTKEEPANGF